MSHLFKGFSSNLNCISESFVISKMGTSSLKNFKKINDWNVFPCYNCGNDALGINDCDICDRKGYLKGNHPMVKMIEQIIESKYKVEAKESVHENLEISTLENALGQNLASSISAQELHQNISCNTCSMKPIRGKRYNCSKCLNYNQCQNCSKQKPHDHQLERVGVTKSEIPYKTLDKQRQKQLLRQSTRSGIRGTISSKYRSY